MDLLLDFNPTLAVTWETSHRTPGHFPQTGCKSFPTAGASENGWPFGTTGKAFGAPQGSPALSLSLRWNWTWAGRRGFGSGFPRKTQPRDQEGQKPRERWLMQDVVGGAGGQNPRRVHPGRVGWGKPVSWGSEQGGGLHRHHGPGAYDEIEHKDQPLASMPVGEAFPIQMRLFYFERGFWVFLGSETFCGILHLC